ncbi:MAG: RNA polymerase sigma factor [Sandaracinaceae bacterium]|nr:RNA polymerase sigma factor [Sandaracinaceae bacterium]
MPPRPLTVEPSDPRVRAAIAGDRRAAQALLEGLLPRVRNLARYLLRGDGEVDDVAQLACIEILRGLAGWRGEASLESWALRITARVARRHARRERAHDPRQVPPELYAVPSPDAAPDAYLERRRLAALLDQLPDAQRDALVLHHVLGLSVPEIAAELDVPQETTRSRLRLGMKRLRELHTEGEA